jgi:hypothetical protein
MTAVGNTGKDVIPAQGMKIVHIWTEAMTTGNTTAVTLKDYGITTLYNVLIQAHDTDYNIIINQPDTTAVSGGVLTITRAVGADTKKRSIILIGA